MKKALNVFLLLGLLLITGNQRFISTPEQREQYFAAALADISSYQGREASPGFSNLHQEDESQAEDDELYGIGGQFAIDNQLRDEGQQAIAVAAVAADLNNAELNDINAEKVEEDMAEVKSQSTVSVKKESLLEQIRIHKVQRGESLWTIAAKYGIDIDTLIGANDIADMNRIRIGDSLRILPVKGILYRINPGENLWSIARQFNISIDKIVEANAIENPDLVQPGTSLLLPGAKPEFGYKDRLAKQFIYPVKGRISSYFGPRWGRNHDGIDFAVNTGTEVRAARSGRVVYSQWANGYGYTVVIEHQKGVRTLYAHNSRLLVHGGQWVEQGQVIALSGNTGNSTGPHLHFEIQINGQPVNPLNYLR